MTRRMLFFLGGEISSHSRWIGWAVRRGRWEMKIITFHSYADDSFLELSCKWILSFSHTFWLFSSSLFWTILSSFGVSKFRPMGELKIIHESSGEDFNSSLCSSERNSTQTMPVNAWEFEASIIYVLTECEHGKTRQKAMDGAIKRGEMNFRTWC